VSKVGEQEMQKVDHLMKTRKKKKKKRKEIKE